MSNFRQIIRNNIYVLEKERTIKILMVSGMKYFVLSALSSGLLLYGCSLLYGFTGSTNFDLGFHFFLCACDMYSATPPPSPMAIATCYKLRVVCCVAHGAACCSGTAEPDGGQHRPSGSASVTPSTGVGSAAMYGLL